MLRSISADATDIGLGGPPTSRIDKRNLTASSTAAMLQKPRAAKAARGLEPGAVVSCVQWTLEVYYRHLPHYRVPDEAESDGEDSQSKSDRKSSKSKKK